MNERIKETIQRRGAIRVEQAVPDANTVTPAALKPMEYLETDLEKKKDTRNGYVTERMVLAPSFRAFSSSLAMAALLAFSVRALV
jgi:hypothetical protein